MRRLVVVSFAGAIAVAAACSSSDDVVPSEDAGVDAGPLPVEDSGVDRNGECEASLTAVDEASACLEEAANVKGVCLHPVAGTGLFAMCIFDPSGKMYFATITAASTIAGANGWTFAPQSNAAKFGLAVASAADISRCDALTKDQGANVRSCVVDAGAAGDGSDPDADSDSGAADASGD